MTSDDGPADRECLWCGGLFTPDHEQARCCSQMCRDLARRASRNRAHHLRQMGASDIPGERRTCAMCRAPLASWNGGRICSPCWSSLSYAERTAIEQRIGRESWRGA